MNPENATFYEFVGELPALGHLQLTKLAQSYEELQSADLSIFFPAETTPERTIVIETMTQGLGMAPLVKLGQPAGAFLEPERIQRRIVEPAIIREDDFLDQGLINQLRMPGTMNSAWTPEQLVARRLQRLVERQQRTLSLLQASVLRGGITWNDPRTNVSISVPTGIPLHNYFRYDGFNATLAAGAPIPNTPFSAAKALVPNKARPEAAFFTNPGTLEAGVPWTNPNADITRCLRLIKQYLMNTNKNVYTHIVMSRDLLTVIQENENIKANLGYVGIFQAPGAAGISSASANTARPMSVSIGVDGDITHLAGLEVVLVDALFRDPETNQIQKMWPSNEVALVAARHFQTPGETLGRTQYCVGESPDQSPGLWVRSGPEPTPPSPPGRSMQLGNSFLPYAMYPQWISLLTVAEEEDVASNLILRSDISYRTF
jgi:hypothetical protein